MASALLQQSSVTPLPFARSESSVQNIHLHKPNWFQYRFGKEHGFGSAILLANAFSTSLQVRAGLKERDISRIVAGSMATALNAWTFVSSRGGKAPEGENAAERIMDTLRHPSQSSVHFALLWSIVISAIFTSGHLYKGLKGDPSEHTRRLTAGLNFLSVALMTTGVFRNYTNKQHPANTPSQVKPVEFAQSRSQQVGGVGRIKEVLQQAWHTDKRGLLGRCLLIGCQLADLREGLAKRHVEGKAASTLLTSALIDLCVQMGQAYYLYERLARDNPRKEQPSAVKR